MNVTYEYYKESFGGSLIPENRWISLELKMRCKNLKPSISFVE